MITDQKNPEVRSHPALEISIEKIGLKAGLIICAALIAYFMIMNLMNMMDSPIAWIFNVIILLGGIYGAYRYYRSETKLNVDYFPGLLLGCITTCASVIPFVVYVYIFLSQSDPQPLLLLKNNILFMGEPVTPLKASAATLIEGISSGFIISFMMMQYYRSGFKRASREKTMHG